MLPEGAARPEAAHQPTLQDLENKGERVYARIDELTSIVRSQES